jgi:tRNA pseudouridine13 synthase
MSDELDIGIYAYLTETRGLGGRLRTKVEDFLVEEVYPAGRPLLPAGNSHTLLKIRARNWETNHLIEEIARQLHIRREAIHFAGMKDKRSVTTQYLTIGLPVEKTKFMLKDVEVLERSPVGSHINLGDASGNRFEIVLRDFKKDERDQAELCRGKILEAGGVPNFYGPQRFGSVRPVTGVVGKAIIHRDFRSAVETYLRYPCEEEDAKILQARSASDPKEAFDLFPERFSYERTLLASLITDPGDYVKALMRLPKNLVMMFVHAYQSYLFNRILSERLKRGLPINEPVEGDIMIVPGGELIPVESTNLEKMRKVARTGKGCVTGIIFGSKPVFARGEMGEIERREIEREGLSPGDFIIPEIPYASSKGERRGLLARISELDISPYEDDALLFRFSLGSGMYATSVMREFMKTEMRYY